ncbi:hypothetical protein D3C75_979910 [compost metagenome]
MEQDPENDQVRPQLNSAGHDVKVGIPLERSHQDKCDVGPHNGRNNTGKSPGDQALAHMLDEHDHGDEGKI